ncbi:MAG: aconitate hydratase AcnA [Ferrovum sp.]|nr:aconitate hydratase AcnA [Ferrovum sp.]
MSYDPYHALQPLPDCDGQFYALSALEKAGIAQVSRLPVSLRIVLESLVRNLDDKRITTTHIEALARWQPNAPRTEEIPFMLARVILQDFTGVPLLADLAAMRQAAQRLQRDPQRIEPLVPVQLVVDHSVQVDHYNTPSALEDNMALEFARNQERYRFMKWGMQAFDTFQVIPPGIGIVHQVNLEYLARGVQQQNKVYYPDTLVGTDSHTTMINGIGVVGWGVGGIEAEAAMLGQPLYFLTPDVVGVHLTGTLPIGVTATDLVLTVTEMLRKAKVVGKFVEFFGAGAAALSLPDRATLANMAPEYGATMGFFPVDDETVRYFAATGRTPAEIAALVAYWKAQGIYGMPNLGDCDYSQTLTLDLGTIEPSVAGPRRPQDRIPLQQLKHTFNELLTRPVDQGGYGKTAALRHIHPADRPDISLDDGSVLIAAITSCTNTSNPGVLLAAGLLAQKAVARGLSVAPWIKTSLAPGSRVVTDYLARAGLQTALDSLGFRLVGYGCTTCIGNTGPLPAPIDSALTQHPLVGCAVLSGNRNFEARIHSSIRANFLMSPPLVVAFALAGRVTIDFAQEPIGHDPQGHAVFLHDLWPSPEELAHAMTYLSPQDYHNRYRDFTHSHPLWSGIAAPTGLTYGWEPSTYIAEPPFFADFAMEPTAPPPVRGAYALALFGDSITTDHISPAGSIKASSPAGQYLQAQGVSPADFNSYGSRRGHHEVMMRGTFANVRLKNLLLPGTEGGVSRHIPSGEAHSIYDVAMRYQAAGIPTVIFAGEEYGTGSSRDWAAKGTRLLGVKAVIAQSFERIHRSNLVGMGVLPCQFLPGTALATLDLDGNETFDIDLGSEPLVPQQQVTLVIHRSQGEPSLIPLLLRIDTPIEVDYYRHGGILPFVLRNLLTAP